MRTSSKPYKLKNVCGTGERKAMHKKRFKLGSQAYDQSDD
jgi:hypothetical protein